MPRLGGVLGMTAPTWWWSAGRPDFARAHVCSAPKTSALVDLTGRAANRDLRSAGAYADRYVGFRSV